MKYLSGLMLALVVAANLTGCSTEKPVHDVFSKETTLVVMEPISPEKSVTGSYARFRDVDGSCQYYGKIQKDAGVFSADIDNKFCVSGPNALGFTPIQALITLGDLKEDLPKNTQLNVIFVHY